MTTNLPFSDLSFNNIEVIKGLETLTKLEDLTLYNNRISKIENMDTLEQLHVFSIGNNEIKDIKDVSIRSYDENLSARLVNFFKVDLVWLMWFVFQGCLICLSSRPLLLTINK